MTTDTVTAPRFAFDPQEEDFRPKDSPYASALVRVSFDAGSEFLVPSGIISNKAPSLPVVDVWVPTPGSCKTCRGPRGPGGFEKQVNLDHLSREVGHVLVHYLFTDKYEALQPGGESFQEKKQSEFVTAIQVADIAQSHDLPSLACLAEMEIKRLGDALSFLRLMDLIEQTSKKILQRPGVLAYVDLRVQELCDELTPTLADDLLSELGTPTTVSKTILKSLISFRKKDLTVEKQEVQLGNEDENSRDGFCIVKPTPCPSSLVFPTMNDMPVSHLGTDEEPLEVTLIPKAEKKKKTKKEKRAEKRALRAEMALEKERIVEKEKALQEKIALEKERALEEKRALEEEKALEEEARALVLRPLQSEEPPWFDYSAEEIDSEVSDDFSF